MTTPDPQCDVHGIARCTICLPPDNPILIEIRAKLVEQTGEQIDISGLADTHPSIAAAYKAGVDVRLLNGATRVSRTGKIAVTRSTRPAFLLVEPKWKGGVFVLGHNDVVVAARTGGKGAPKGGWVNIAKVEGLTNGVQR